jgi:protein tyrosine/serine phosphatase
MDSIYKGELHTKAGRRNAWVDALFIDHAIFRLLWTNFAAVEPGRLYRSNHPTPRNLAAFTRRVGLRALINLRGQARNGSADIYRNMRAPALIHCKSGADRAGLAAGLYVLIQGGTAAQAMAQLSWRFGHIKQSKTGILDSFILSYARDGEGKKSFLDWVLEDYDEMRLRSEHKGGKLAGFLNDVVLRRE